MKFRFSAVMAVLCLCLIQVPGAFADAKWYDVRAWFRRRGNSTTVTGTVDSVTGRTVMCRTHDGQMIQLLGRRAEQIGENRGVNIRVFGNVKKPDARYPTGALDVRNFRVLDAVAPAAHVTIGDIYLEPEPVYEPYTEPGLAVAPSQLYYPEPIVVGAGKTAPLSYFDDEDECDDDYYYYYETPAPAAPVAAKTYVVKSGDTLAKISREVYGTTQRWREIASHNKITDPKLLRVGMTLQIP